MTTNSEALNPSANIFRVVDTKSGKTSTVVRVKAETEFSEPYINTFRSHWVEPAVGRCSCGREVVLSEAPRTRWTAVRATNPASARKDIRAREGRGSS